MQYIVFHKVDWDGYASAAIAIKAMPEALLIPFNYNMTFPFDILTKDDEVYFVDVTIQPHTELLRIKHLVNKLVILDHHKSFLDSDIGKLLSHGLCNTKEAACEITWNYFFPDTTKPLAIGLIGQYDSWRESEDDWIDGDSNWLTVMQFQFGLRQYEFNIDNFIGRFLTDDYNFSTQMIKKTIEIGHVTLTYQDRQNTITMNSSFESDLNGYKCLCVNTGMRNSSTFKSKWNPAKHDFMIAFSFDGKNKRWSYSAYTTRKDRDASELAKLYYGGGHKGAAGFYTNDLIFEGNK